MKTTLTTALLLSLTLATISCTSLEENDGFLASTPRSEGQPPKAAPAPKTQLGGAPIARNASTRATAAAASAAKTSSAVARHSYAYPTGDVGTSAVLLEKIAPRQAQAGGQLEYEIQVTNLTDHNLDNVVVSEAFHSNFKMASAQPAAASMNGNTAIWNLGVLKADAAQTIVVRGMPQGAGTVRTCSNVSYDTAVCMSIDVVKPELTLLASATPEVIRCDDIELHYQVQNKGTGTARNVVVEAALPQGLKTSKGETKVRKVIGDLASGKSQDFTVIAKAATKGRFQHTATANAEGGLKASSANVATVVREPVLQIAKTGPKKTFAGRSLNYEITLTNSGDGVARDTVISDRIPSGLKFVSASTGGRSSAGVVSWKLGDLQPGATKKVELKLAAERMGTFTNTAVAEAYCAEQVRSSVQTEITGIPAILMEVVDLDDPIEVGANETYVVSITNQGTAPGTGIQIVCTLPPNTQYVSSSGATRGTLVGSTLTFAKLPALDAKEKADWKIIVRGNRPADARFRVSLTSDQLTSPVDESEATNFYE